MSKLNKAFGGTGIAVAVLAAVALSGCDPYVKGNTSPPKILGVIVADLNLNGIQPAQCSVSTTWGCSADFDCPAGESCVYPTDQASGSTATCNPTPVGQLAPDAGCIYHLPRRAGAIWGPGYPGEVSGTWTVANAPVGAGSIGWPGTGSGFVWAFGQIRVIFNKLMDGATIQTDPTVTTPPAGSDFKIVETIGAVNTTVCDPNGTPAVPCQFDVYYDPSSPTPNYGSAMVVQPSSYNGGLLLPGASYHITATTVKDHQARAIPIDVTVTTVP